MKELRELTNLEKLDLHGTQITDAGLEHLRKLNRLQRLILAGTDVTDEGAKRLEAAFPKLEIER